jgi:ATP-dependent Clp protease ATP-binding subunit ClpB
MGRLRQEAEQAERDYDLNLAAELRLGRLPELERRLHAEEERLAAKQGGERLLREVVTDDEIALIVSRWTGIPVSRLQEGEWEKLVTKTVRPAPVLPVSVYYCPGFISLKNLPNTSY